MLDILRQRFERQCQKTDLIVAVFARRPLFLPPRVAEAEARARRRLSSERSGRAVEPQQRAHSPQLAAGFFKKPGTFMRNIRSGIIT